MTDSKDAGSAYTKGGEVWDLESLTRLTDEVRTCLGAGSMLTDEQVEVVGTVMKRLLADDKSGNPQGLSFIAKTRFDMLVRDILAVGMQGKEQRANLEPLEMKSFALQRTWRKHFKASVFNAMIDEERQKILEEVSMKNVTLQPGDAGKWIVEEAKPECYSHTEGSIGFEVGQWWLNIACCYRDGIVGKMVDDMTTGPYGVTAMPLLSGEELQSSLPDCFTYYRTGPIQDMYLSLMNQLGQKNVRILRGYKLKSPNAPKAGIRYDGLYTPIEYSHKFNQVSTSYEVKVVFKKSWGTPSVATLLHIPTPSQMDEWKLYLLTADEKPVSRPKRIRLVPQAKEERTVPLLKEAEFLEALKSASPSESLSEGPQASQSSSIPTRSKSSKKKKLIPQGREERGDLMRSSDFMDMLNEGRDTPPVPPKPAAATKNKKKLIPAGNEEKGGMSSSDLMDMLNEGPDEAMPSTKPPPASASVTKAKSVKKSAAPAIKVPPPATKNTDGEGEKEPVIVKKRVKARDPYDIDAMMKEIEDDSDFNEDDDPKLYTWIKDVDSADQLVGALNLVIERSGFDVKTAEDTAVGPVLPPVVTNRPLRRMS